MKPITPSEAVEAKKKSIPPAVIEAFNELIVENLKSSGESRILQKDVVRKIVVKTNTRSDDVFSYGWLDVEKLFEEAGWKVTYDKPAYCESYDAYFIFRRKNS